MYLSQGVFLQKTTQSLPTSIGYCFLEFWSFLLAIHACLQVTTFIREKNLLEYKTACVECLYLKCVSWGDSVYRIMGGMCRYVCMGAF